MTDVFLGVIAAAVLVMATIQVAAIVFAARAARRVGDAVSRLERDVRPIVANLQAISADAARATGLAAAQMERADRMLSDVSMRIDEVLTSVQKSIVTPARDGLAVLQGLKAAVASLLEGRQREGGHRRPAAAEEEDALFIG